jgi:hypothetical protein
MNCRRPARLLISVIWFLQIFVLSLSAVAPQADDYWQCVCSNDCSPRCLAFWTSDQNSSNVGSAANGHSQSCEQAVTVQSSNHCRFVLIDPDGDALTPLTSASFVAPDFHATPLPTVWPLSIPSLPEAAMPSLTRRGPPPSNLSRSPFSLRAPPLS